MSSENEFEQGDSGALNTELADAGRMKPGSLVMMKEGAFPCRVTGFSTAKPGKHGSAKAMITAKDIFTEKQYEETFGTGDMIPRPIVVKTEYTCMCYDDDGALSLLDVNGETKDDVSFPTAAHLSDLAPKIKLLVDEGEKDCLVTVQRWGDKEQLISCREALN